MTSAIVYLVVGALLAGAGWFLFKGRKSADMSAGTGLPQVSEDVNLPAVSEDVNLPVQSEDQNLPQAPLNS